MKTIVAPIYNSYVQPTEILSYYVITSENDIVLYNNKRRPKTPYWRVPVKPISEFILDDIILFDKKNFFKLALNTDEYDHMINDFRQIDLNALLWHYDQEPVEINHIDYVYQPATYFLNKITSKIDFEIFNDLSQQELPLPYDTIIKACARLDGYIKIDGEVLYKCYDHYTSTGRLRDTGASTLSMKKESRKNINRSGVVLEFDMESFHLRILDMLIDGEMPKDQRGHDWIVEGSKLDPYKDDIKTEIFKAIYSENFDMIDHKFFRKLKRRYKKLHSPLRRPHNNFNYIIQEHEVLTMSKIINKLYPHCNDILLYLYDGLYFDVDPDKIEEFINICREHVNLPFTIKIGNTEKRFA